MSYAAARANGFREASLCCALCAQPAHRANASQFCCRVARLAPVTTFTLKSLQLLRVC